MAFFFKKSESTESKVRNFPASGGWQSAQPATAPTSVPVVESTPSAEGLAIAQRLSGQKIAVPAGFSVRADHFQLEGGCLVAGELEARVVSCGRNEVLPGACLKGIIDGDEIAVRGTMLGQGVIDRLTIQAGGECRGSFRGSSLVLNEGGIFDGDYTRSR